MKLLKYLICGVAFLMMLDAARVSAADSNKKGMALNRGPNITSVKLGSSLVVTAEVDVATYKARYSDMPYEPFSWWGAGEKAPTSVIKKFVVKENGKSIIILPAIYDYIGNPRLLEIRPFRTGFIIRILGADAGDSYIATFYFREGRLIKRRVELGEYQDDIYEETIYVNKEIGSGR